jgi:hypothetical protein
MPDACALFFGSWIASLCRRLGPPLAVLAVLKRLATWPVTAIPRTRRLRLRRRFGGAMSLRLPASERHTSPSSRFEG